MQKPDFSEFRIVFDGDLSDDARNTLEKALQRTAMEQLARMDMLPVAAAARFPELKLRPEWFGIWIKRGYMLDLDRVKQQFDRGPRM